MPVAFCTPLSWAPRTRRSVQAPRSRAPRFRRRGPSFSMSGNSGNDDDPALPEKLPLRARERAGAAALDFVTQRATQQSIFTSRVLRDETTARWLNEFCGGGMEDTHVCDRLRNADGERVSSEGFIRSLLTAPAETILVRKPYAGRGGSTNTNPYIKKKYFEYEVDVSPRRIGMRVLDARLKIAEELTGDLTMVGRENERLWKCFRQAVEAGEDVDVVDALDAAFSSALLDRGAFANVESGTPYREANYDLASNMVSFIACEHLILEMETGGQDSIREGEWLRKFCQPRLSGLLQPPRGIRRAADAFFAALLSESPLLRDSKVMCDPLRLCERILGIRLAIAGVWVEALGDVPTEQLDIERGLLEGGLSL